MSWYNRPYMAWYWWLVIPLIFILGLVLAALVPLMTIWALNTLFRLGIPITFETWLSVWILLFAVRGNVTYTRKG